MSFAERARGLRWSRALGVGAAVALLAGLVPSAHAAEISDIVALPGAGQSAEQQRRDRYDCHNWVIAQNRTIPAGNNRGADAARERRAGRIDKVITGAAVGATAGSVIRGARDYREAGEGALAGGVLGAIAGAVIGGVQENKKEDDSFDEYFRALDACMTARGYTLHVTNAD